MATFGIFILAMFLVAGIVGLFLRGLTWIFGS